MGRDFFENSQIAKDLIQSSSDRLKIDFEKLIFSENSDLNQTEFTQPAILLVSSIAFRLFAKSLNIVPKYVLGHSLGEFSALVSVGALDILDAVELTHKRGLFMKNSCEGLSAGMMAVVGIEDFEAEKICELGRKDGLNVWCANYNSDGQIVLAGVKEDLEKIQPNLKSAGAKKSILLNMSIASHCPLLEQAKESLEPYLQEYIKSSFNSPIISNVTAKKYDSKSDALKLLSSQLVSPVLYKQSIKAIESDIDIFVEFGNGNTLKGLNRRITKKPTLNVNDIATLERAIEKLQ
jgi:[acyl-carrier-protein] S-malonyltransferase